MKTAFIVLPLLAVPLVAGSVESYTVKPGEVAQMPDYCQVKLAGGSAAEKRAWGTKFGALWEDMHHFCHGLKFIQRASRPGISPQDRSFNLTSSLGEFEYILRSKNAKGGHWFLPDVHFQRATAYRHLGRHKEAAAETRKGLAARR
ncbi:MAG TPA: hypothetical protein VIQ62_10965 [Burkholderiales bacterium]|jgi:hypothetical protein